MQPANGQIPAGFTEIPGNVEVAPNLRYFRSPDELREVHFGTLTGTVTIWARRTLTTAWSYLGMVNPERPKFLMNGRRNPLI